MLKGRASKILVFLLCLAPLFWLGWRGWNQDLTPNPIEFITHFTGDWTIRLIVAAVVPPGAVRSGRHDAPTRRVSRVGQARRRDLIE